METLYIITGPTAVGKTSLSIQWAKANNAEIVSCDSLLFYRGMDIGTAKPKPEEREGIKHFGIDLVECDQPYNIGKYVIESKKWVDDIMSRGKNVLITGGSGFYLKSYVAPVVDEIHIPQNIDTEVDQIYQKSGLEAVVGRLREVSPTDYDMIDLQNSRRVIPALKRCLASGLSLSELRTRMTEGDQPFGEYKKKSLLLERSIDELTERIGIRTQQMLTEGLIEEVKILKAKGIERNPSACGSIGYRETLSYLRGEIDRKTLEQDINQNTLKLVKKQLKWFRNQMEFEKVMSLDRGTLPMGDWF